MRQGTLVKVLPSPQPLWVKQLAIRLGCKQPQPSRWLSRRERDLLPSPAGTAGGSLRSNGVPTGVPLAGVRAGDEGMRYLTLIQLRILG